MNRRTLLAGIITSPFLCWLGFKPKQAEASKVLKNGDEPFALYTIGPYENIEDGDRGTVLYYDFQYNESKRINKSRKCRFVEFPTDMTLSVGYSKDDVEWMWRYICYNPKFDGYPFNIKKFIDSPLMDDDGIMHPHSNIRPGNIPHRMYGPNKFILNSIAIAPFHA